MLKIFINALFLYSMLLAASPQIRSAQSELQKMLGLWEISSVIKGTAYSSYFTLTDIMRSDDGSYYASGLDSEIDYERGNELLCFYQGTNVAEDYICTSWNNTQNASRNWYFFNITGWGEVTGKYAQGTVEEIDELYAINQTAPLTGVQVGCPIDGCPAPDPTPVEDILQSNLSVLKSTLLATKEYGVSGSFAPYNFTGVDDAFDWTFVTPSNIVYQLQGSAPSDNDAFGWKKVSVTPSTPSWYMSYLGDWDSDGNGKYDWILVGNGFDAVYKLEGVTDTGNFAYSDKIDVPYSVSSDKKMVTFGENTIGDSKWTIDNGGTIELPVGVTSESVDFEQIEKPEHLGENISAYTYSTDSEVKSAAFTLPIEFSNIKDKDDLRVLYVRKSDNAYKILDFSYDSTEKEINFEVKDNWNFEYIPEKIKASTSIFYRINNINTIGSEIYIIKQENGDSFPNAKEAIRMPFYFQMGQTCWAATGQIIKAGYYPAGQVKNNHIYDYLRKLNISIDAGLSPTHEAYNSFLKLISDDNQGKVEFYYSINNLREKLLMLLNKNYPVMLSAAAHQVVVLGYEETSKGLELIVHNPAVLNGMYQRKNFLELMQDDMSFVAKKLSITAATIAWIETDLDSNRVLQSVSIPDGFEESFDIYFYGPKTDKDSSIRISLKYNHQVAEGYEWSKSHGSNEYLGGVFPKNIETFILTLPAWNTAKLGESLSLNVKIYQKNNVTNEVLSAKNFQLLGHEEYKYNLDLKPLMAKLTQAEDFILNITLLDSYNKSLSSTNIEKITLQPSTIDNTVITCSTVEAPICPINNPFGRHEITSGGQEYACYYDYSTWLTGEFPSGDGIFKKYYPGAIIKSASSYKNGKLDGYSLACEHNSLTRCDLYENGVKTQSCMP